ncbi:hypothetical protein HDU76_006104 [Blyttiomyces sp. JEL0837]|nr:hypothetical protein HDU76_006104 [Blyttiomyces sp. JEL0837]
MKKKVLLMGKSGSGKTSMRSIIFANYIARDTRRLGATIDVEHSHVRFLGNLVLNLWDCGGQEVFMENYIASQRDHIFRNVEVLIYVFDVESRDIERDIYYYKSCIDAIKANSKDAKVFCLLHKMDLVSQNMREEIFRKREDDLKVRSLPMNVTCFQTSIWDESLYKAWSSIVYSLIPNVKYLETHLENFCHLCDATEVVLFERTTFLVISHSTHTPPPAIQYHTPHAITQGQQGQGQLQLSSASSVASSTYRNTQQLTAVAPDSHRFEKISNIIKQFKLSCSRSQSQFQNMEVRGKGFAAFVDVLTPNTYVMVVMSDPSIQSAATMINIAAARKHFEKIEQGQFGMKG